MFDPAWRLHLDSPKLPVRSMSGNRADGEATNLLVGWP